MLAALATSSALGADRDGTWITLGTAAGPIPDPVRSQPANVLVLGEKAYVVDAGDGTAGRLAQAGVSLHAIDAIFISHLHFDHTGGLAALLALRYQISARNTVTVYGPPGTQRTVAGLIDFMRPMAEAGTGMPGQTTRPTGSNINVVEIRDGSVIELEDITVRATRNTHMSFPQDSEAFERHQSLSLRFDLPGRSIAYTGDTGPSSAVEDLAQGADVLISEVMDVDRAIARVKHLDPDIAQPWLEMVSTHLRAHHVSPEQVGEMAARANVGKVVLTHLAPPMHEQDEMDVYIGRVGKTFDGDVVVANDLDRF